MSALVTAIGTTVSAMNADRRAPRDRDRPEAPEDVELEGSMREPERAAAPALPATTHDVGVLPHTLLSASLLGQRLHSFNEALHSMKLLRSKAWTPPESDFKLKDKTI